MNVLIKLLQRLGMYPVDVEFEIYEDPDELGYYLVVKGER